MINTHKESTCNRGQRVKQCHRHTVLIPWWCASSPADARAAPEDCDTWCYTAHTADGHLLSLTLNTTHRKKIKHDTHTHHTHTQTHTEKPIGVIPSSSLAGTSPLWTCAYQASALQWLCHCEVGIGGVDPPPPPPAPPIPGCVPEPPGSTHDRDGDAVLLTPGVWEVLCVCAHQNRLLTSPTTHSLRSSLAFSCICFVADSPHCETTSLPIAKQIALRIPLIYMSTCVRVYVCCLSVFVINHLTNQL